MCIDYELGVGIRTMVEADIEAVSEIEKENFSDSWPLEGFADCLIFNENFVLYLIDGAEGQRLLNKPPKPTHAPSEGIARSAPFPSHPVCFAATPLKRGECEELGQAPSHLERGFWPIDPSGHYQIIGYMIGMGVIDEYSIYNLAIRSMHQRRGLGSYLLSTVMRMHGDKYNKYLLEVRVSNFKAINFYRKFNFHKVYIRKNYYNNPVEDAQIMELEINAQAG